MVQVRPEEEGFPAEGRAATAVRYELVGTKHSVSMKSLGVLLA